MKNKYIEIIPEKEKDFINSVSEILDNIDSGMSAIQIHEFVLNSIEYPTDYFQYKQAKVEMKARLDNLIEYYYNLKEAEIELRKLDRDIVLEQDNIERELLEVKKERKQIEIDRIKRSVNTTIRELREFFIVYDKNKGFDKLSEKDKHLLEAEGWTEKAKLDPTTFEKQFGEQFMVKALGKEELEKYQQIRRQTMGLLPRELLDIEQLGEPQ